MDDPDALLAAALERALAAEESLVASPEVQARTETVALTTSNRAVVRLLMACLLARLHRPELDPRKPYTEIGTPDSFSGRTYDEQHVGPFVTAHRLPCNPTTAFLTPALRNRNQTLEPATNLVGRPAAVYRAALELLDDVYATRVAAGDLLAETIRLLVRLRNDNEARRASLMERLARSGGEVALSSGGIATLISQHLALRGTSRLPVLMVAALYAAISDAIGERARPLQGHNAADLQTGALGDVEITLTNDDRVVTSYEMKDRPVTRADVDAALTKLAATPHRVNNYVFVTTASVTDEVQHYASSLYRATGGTEVALLDAVGFVRHVVHLFHRRRTAFLDAYQRLMLGEPDSAVSVAVKDAFLAMRLAAESGEAEPH